MYILGVYNNIHDLVIWKVPREFSDPAEVGAMKYFACIPLFLNFYLIKEFVKARQKAESQLAERKKMVEEKQEEILDSIRYAQRIQRSLLPSEKFIQRIIKSG
jgi:hypothetical protein